MKLKLITLTLLCMSTLTFAQNDWQTYAKDNYGITYPKTWEYSAQKTQPNVQFILLSEAASQDKDQFRENINLSTERLGKQTLSLEAYTTTSLNQIKTQLPTAKILSNTSVKVNGMEASDIIWTGTFGTVNLKFRQLLFIYNETAYILTYSSTQDEFDTYSEVADKILNSFKFAR